MNTKTDVMSLLRALKGASETMDQVHQKLRAEQKAAAETNRSVVSLSLEPNITKAHEISASLKQLYMSVANDDGPLWVQEFGIDFDVPDVLTQMFHDISWHNDAIPSFTLECDGGNTLRIWVDHPDDALREIQGGRRFGLQTQDGGGTLYETDDIMEIVYLFLEPTNKDEAEKFVCGWIKVIGGGFHPDTPFDQYIEFHSRDRVIQDDDVCQFLDQCLAESFNLLEDVYEIGMDEMRRLGYAPHPEEEG